jgi:hypothetical protein
MWNSCVSPYVFRVTACAELRTLRIVLLISLTKKQRNMKADLVYSLSKVESYPT